MKIKTSYFYQIRNFKPYQIPLSTAISDPAWYHSKTGDYYIDKNGVINGLRIGMLQPQRSLGYLCGGKNCMQKPNSCEFLRAYYGQLCLLDFKKLMCLLEQTADVMQNFLKFGEEPEIILIVHEAPTNPCSERKVIQQYFKEHGIACTEFRKEEYK